MAEIADDIVALRGMVDDYEAGHAVLWDDDDLRAMRAVLRTLEERRGFETWCEGAAITLKHAADILCDLGTEEADDVYAQAYTALNLCPVEIPTPLEEREWLPIESAPKTDGTEILLYDSESGCRSDDLAMLVKRLLYRVRKIDPDSVVVKQSANFLAAHGLSGSPLRDDAAPSDAAREGEGEIALDYSERSRVANMAASGEGDAERARALVDSLPPTEASPPWMLELEKAIAAAVRSSRQERDAARGYLIRNVLLPLHPNIKAAPDLLGVCTQVDNVTAGLREERDAALRSSREELDAMRAQKDTAYIERNQIVAALARLFPSGITRTNIPGWSDDWHGAVYIDLPTGQVSWHYHDSQAPLFAGLPPYTGEWDGHTTEIKYERLAALTGSPQE